MSLAPDEDPDATHDRLERLFRRVLALSRESDGEIFDDAMGDAVSALDAGGDAHLATYLAAALLVSVTTRDSALEGFDQWTDAAEWEGPVLAWLQDNDADASERIAGSAHALGALTDGLLALLTVGGTSSKARFAVGDRVMAVLTQDDAWHEAKVERVDEDSNAVTYHVRFVEYGAPQTVKEDEITYDASWLDEDEGEDACRVCRRVLPLTFHHLVPREVHAHVLRKDAKQLISELEPLYAKRSEAHKAKSRKDWLQIHGINICRKCHSQIHTVEPNITLALEYNTLERVLAHPGIVKWRSYASKLK